jgi:hypothetical protein
VLQAAAGRELHLKRLLQAPSSAVGKKPPKPQTSQLAVAGKKSHLPGAGKKQAMPAAAARVTSAY